MIASSLLALSLTFGMVAPPPSDPAELLPAETLVYFGSTSVRDAWQAGQNTAMTQILSEPEVKAFLHEPLAAANQVIKAGMEQMKDKIAAAKDAAAGMGVEGDFDLENFSFSLDTSEPVLGRTFFAITNLDLAGTQDKPGPQVGLAIGIELLDASMLDQARKLWGSIPGEESQGSYAGVPVLTRVIPDSPLGLNLAFLDSLVVITTDGDALHGMIDRHQGRASGQSLADAQDYRAMLDAAGGLLPGGSSSFVRVAPLAQVARMALMMATQMSGEMDQSQAALVLSLYDAIGLDAIQLSGSVSAVGSDGLIYSTSVMSVDAAAPGLIAKLTGSSGAVDTGLLATIPADSTGASISTLGTQLVDAYDFIIEVARGAAPDEVAQAEDQLASLLGGASLRDDLLANPRGTFISYSTPGQGMMGQSDTVMSMGLTDAPAFVAVLGTLLDSISAEVGMPIKLVESEHEGLPFYEIDLSATPLALALSPGFALQDGQLVLATNTKTLKSVLNGSIAAGSKTLASNERLAAFVKGLEAQGDVSAISFTNVSESFGAQYGQLVGMAQMFPMGDLPLDVSKLPPQSVIGQHLDESYNGGYVTQSGMSVSRSVSHFAMADFLPLAVIGGALYAGQQMGITVEETAVEADPAEQAQNDLRELKASITVYKISMGGYPNSLGDLLTPLDDFPQGAYPHGELPADPWGNGYRYAMEEHPKKKRLMPKLWSLGPNGLDENGEGDDILKF